MKEVVRLSRMIDGLVARVLRVDQEAFPTEASMTALSTLKQLLGAARGGLEGLRRKDDARMFELVSELRDWTEIIERSNINRIPGPVVGLCDDCLRMIAPNVFVFYAVTAHHNYHVRPFSRVLRERSVAVLGELPEALETLLVKDLICVLVPQGELETVPMYANLGHEFGHLLVGDTDLQRVRRAAGKFVKDIEDRSLLGSKVSPPRAFESVLVAAAVEALCDWHAATIMGPAVAYALREMAMFGVTSWHASVTEETPFAGPQAHAVAYPSAQARLKLLARHPAMRQGDGGPIDGAVHSAPEGNRLREAIARFFVSSPEGSSACSEAGRSGAPTDMEQFLGRNEAAIVKWLGKLVPKLAAEVEVPAAGVDAGAVFALVGRLDRRVPPDWCESCSRVPTFAEVLLSAALTRLGTVSKRDAGTSLEVLAQEIDIIDRLAAKAVESVLVQNAYTEYPRSGERGGMSHLLPPMAQAGQVVDQRGGVIERSALLALLRHPTPRRRLTITPLLAETQIGPASVDVRLGTTIIVPQTTHLEGQDITRGPEHVRQIEHRGFRRIRLQLGQRFVLHPKELILAVTLEYLSIPDNVFSSIASRSSWGRLGLVVATAAGIQPGFQGCLTLELANLGGSPIVLYPGLAIGQIVFHWAGGTFGEDEGARPTYTKVGRYVCPTEADVPRFFGRPEDDEMFWGENGGARRPNR